MFHRQLALVSLLAIAASQQMTVQRAAAEQPARPNVVVILADDM